MTQHDDLPYLKHIIDAINDTEDSVITMSKKQFKKNKDAKAAAVRRLEIIGEAAKNISKELKEKYPKIEWAKMAGTRDVMIHAYFNVDMDIVWDIIKKNLPDLKRKIQKVLEEEQKN